MLDRIQEIGFLRKRATMGRIRGTRNWELVWVWHSCVGGPPVLFAKVHQDRKDFISTAHPPYSHTDDKCKRTKPGNTIAVSNRGPPRTALSLRASP